MKKYFLFLTIIFTSCVSVKTRYLQGDVIGFSDEVTTSYDPSDINSYTMLKYPGRGWNLLTEKEKEAMKDYIKKRIPRGDNTTAYYAMELAAERIKYIRRQHAKHDPQTKFYIFLLTDGLDNGSPTYAQQKRKILFNISEEKYEERLQKKFKKAMGRSKNTFETYPMLWVGDDMKNILKENNQKGKDARGWLEKQMKCFRYSSVGEAPKLITSTSYERILTELKKIFVSSNYTFRVPKSYNNKKIRMTFENEEGEKISLTGTLRRKGSSYLLDNIAFDNPRATYLKTSQFCSKDGKSLISHEPPQDEKSAYMNAYFTIEDLRLGNSSYFPLPEKVEQRYESRSMWILNSEYREITKTTINTYFILVLDGSNSLDGKYQKTNGFEQEIDMAITILDILTQNQL